MLINLILIVVVLTLYCCCFDFVNGKPSNSEDVGTGDHFKPCLEWIKCKPGDKDLDVEINSCLDLGSDEKIKKVVKSIGDFAGNEWADIPAVFVDYCLMAEDTQKYSFFSKENYIFLVDVF
ncbi:uncharacterized protein [Parasteatoda tepidariorum]|uniref:uncharacterized protein n=1 Tax=Parasteatoda tepidariorum TaxID=114398 RepID=UPI0039BCF8E5